MKENMYSTKTNFISSLIFSICFFSGFSLIKANCPSGWANFAEENICIYVENSIKAWDTARSTCLNLNADLVKITSEKKTDFIESLINVDANDYWIGLNDREQEGTFEWADGTSLGSEYTNWGYIRADWFGTRDCVTLRARFNGEWQDTYCDIAKRFLCESSADDVIAAPTTPKLPNLEKTSSPPFVESGTCGTRKNTFNIVGGNKAAKGSWPWQAQLSYGVAGEYYFYCGGTIVSEDHVVTAAHCVDGLTKNDIYVTLGEYDFNKEDGQEQHFEVECIHMHENYDPDTIDNDIALLKLKRKDGAGIQFNEYVNAACLPTDTNEFQPPKECWISGWGTTDSGDTATTLREAKIPLIDCADTYNTGITKNMLCAGYMKGGIDACQGDSGGPLVCQSEDDWRWKLWGVTSWGIGCGTENYPGVYTRVAEFLSWIQKMMSPSSC